VDLHRRLDTLLTLAEEVGLMLRREPLGGEGGGCCMLKGRRVLFLDTTADLEVQYEKTLAALAPLPELEKRFLPPEVRDDLDRAKRALT